MTTLQRPLDVRAQWREAGRLAKAGLAWALFAIGWMVAKALRGVGTLLAWLLFAVGYVGGRMVWPGLLWCGRAVRLGWEQGRKPGLGAG